MKRSFRSQILASTLLVSATSFALPAAAQDAAAEPVGVTTAEDPAVQVDEAAGEEIVVTGSLIRNPNLELSTPVNVTTAANIELKQSNTAEDVLRELPGVVANMGSAVNNGNGGTSYVDLRGLGANRNIVLLDGKRIVPDDGNGQVDLNNIPLALIERVDALTGAAVTTYGADAITGVVNFVTKRDFSGFELTASEQITEKGDGNYFRLDATMGGNFDDGRGNAVLSLGYQDSDPVYQGDRPFSFESLDSYSGENIGSGTSFPTRIGGTRPLIAGTNTPNTSTAVGNGGLRQINAAGAAVGTFQFYNFNPFNLFQTPFGRFNIYGAANYEVSDSIEVYARGMYSKTSVDTIAAPSGAFGQAVVVNLNNPFLPSTLRNQFCAFNIAPVNPATGTQTTYVPRFTAAQCAAAATATGRTDPNYREVTAQLNRRSVEYGPRLDEFRLNTFDYRFGVRGALTDSLDWDLNGSYGQSDNSRTRNNYVILERFRQGILVDGTAANPRCQNTANNCMPIDIFGTAGINPATKGFAVADARAFRGSKLVQAQALISGDLGWILPSATNAVGIAVGAEYRNHFAYQDADILESTPGAVGGSGGAVIPFEGRYDVREAFGELIVPLIEDRPFFESLTLEAGVRYSDYKVEAPGDPAYDTWTWKVGGSWEPGAGVKFRGNYSRAVRAPNIAELFTPFATGLTNLGVDPCAGSAPVTNANLRAICVAQGAPASTIGSINNPTAAQANISTEGNTNLQPEKANTYTVGVVFQPDFLPRFNVSVDYYNIKVSDAIGTPLPGDLISACFANPTAASAADPACTIIRRNPLTGSLDGDPGTVPGLYAQTTNLGRLSTDGVDLIANYRKDLGFADLALSFVGNWTRSSKFKASPSSLNRECVGFYSVNCSFTGSIQPELQFSQRTTLSFEKVDLSLLWRWIDAVQFEPQQLADDLQAARDAGTSPATGCPDPEGTDPNGCMVNPEFRTIEAQNYFDLTARVKATEELTFTFTVQNLLNNKPTVVGNTIGSTNYNSGNTFPSTYDALGRRYAVSAKLRF
ncbi:MAG: TonB-dependent receptor [Sphingosinicella sp.]|nr:TonB-dependent receptor [Sphingosinicella sp.]